MVSNLKLELENTKSELNKFRGSTISNKVASVNQSCGNFEIYDIKDKEMKTLQK